MKSRDGKWILLTRPIIWEMDSARACVRELDGFGGREKMVERGREEREEEKREKEKRRGEEMVGRQKERNEKKKRV